ncbi:MAG: hypothetical protein QM831_44030 [Kofleriaceae bacterium]
MSPTWIDSYCVLRDRATELRGVLELDDGTHVPNTTGHDAIAIASVFDLATRRDGSPGLVSRWITTLTELADDALAAPFESYPANPSFWDLLADAVVYLDDRIVPAPAPEIWTALDRQLVEGESRNEFSDVIFSPVHYDDVYLDQYTRFRDQRGADVLPVPTGMNGVPKPIPRTTNADVLALRTQWGRLLAHSPFIEGTSGVVSRWRAASEDVDALAHGDPDDVYPNNNEFWRVLGQVAAHVAVASEDGPRRNAGPSGEVPFGPFASVKTFDDLFLAQLNALRTQRGSDVMPVPTGSGGSQMAIPRTTNADVVQLADYWTKQLAAVKKVSGREAIEARWKTALADVDKLARAGKPTEVYAKNNEFWHSLGPLTTHIAAADEAPTPWDRFKESLDYSIHHIPETIESAAVAVGHGAAAVAEEVKSIAWGTVRTPLILGAVGLGAYLLLRGGD